MKESLVPTKTYVRIWVALLVLLLLTWGLAQFNLGPFNTVAALLIALAKMTLVILVFMHVKYSSRLTWLFVAAGFIWFAIMVDLTLSDYLTRRPFQEPRPTPETRTAPAPGFTAQSGPPTPNNHRRHSDFHLREMRAIEDYRTGDWRFLRAFSP